MKWRNNSDLFFSIWHKIFCKIQNFFYKIFKNFRWLKFNSVIALYENILFSKSEGNFWTVKVELGGLKIYPWSAKNFWKTKTFFLFFFSVFRKIILIFFCSMKLWKWRKDMKSLFRGQNSWGRNFEIFCWNIFSHFFFVKSKENIFWRDFLVRLIFRKNF